MKINTKNLLITLILSAVSLHAHAMSNPYGLYVNIRNRIASFFNEEPKSHTLFKDAYEKQDVHGNTPLHRALNEKPEKPGSSFAYLSGEDKEKELQRIERKNKKITPNQIATINNMVEVKADINIKNANGDTPLMIAAANGVDATVIDSLIKAKADLYAKDADGLTPLQLAEKYRHTTIVDQLRVAMGIEKTQDKAESK